MSAFDPDDAADLPAAIREFHRARRVWLAAYAKPPAEQAEAAGRLDAAQAALRQEIQSRGGTWTHGRFRYHLDRHDGIEIEQTYLAGADEAGAAGAPATEPGRAETRPVAPA